MIEVYSDGSSTGRSDAPGGWAYVILLNGEVFSTNYGGHPRTTNNLQELEGAIQGLKAVEASPLLRGLGIRIRLVSDSRYTLGIADGTMNPVKNLEKARELRDLAERLRIEVKWVRGHRFDPWNERCDRLAKRGKAENTPAVKNLHAESGQAGTNSSTGS